jgi:oxygen-dependent protoporphyrinogen oxidase
VYRWRGATPQIEVGHAALMRTIDQALDRHPGLFVSASGFRGTGIPDCVADARRQAGARPRRGASSQQRNGSQIVTCVPLPSFSATAPSSIRP